jgi:hypothetical protein
MDRSVLSCAHASDPLDLGRALASDPCRRGRRLFLLRICRAGAGGAGDRFCQLAALPSSAGRVGGNTTVAATIAIILIVTFLITPIVFAVTYTTGEVREWVAWLIHANRFGEPTPLWISSLPFAGPYLDDLWVQYIGSPGTMGEVIQAVSGAHIGNIYRAVLAAGGGAFHLLLTLLFMLIALFFVYRDGASFRARSTCSASASCRTDGSAFRGWCLPRSARPSWG